MSQGLSEIYLPLLDAGVERPLAAAAARVELWPASATPGAKSDPAELRQLETMRLIADLRREVGLLRKELEALRAALLTPDGRQ